MLYFTLIAVVCLIGVSLYLRHEIEKQKRKKSLIELAVERAGGELVRADRLQKHSLQGAKAYSVTWLDLHYRQHHTTCLLTDDGMIYWEQSPMPLMPQAAAWPMDSFSHLSHGGETAVSSSSKEQIISDLYAENEQLRQQLDQIM